MQQNVVEYSDAIRALGTGEEAPKGYDIVKLDRNGKQVSGLGSILPGKRHNVAIQRNFHRSITNAAARVKHFLEPQIFQTREKTEFNLYLRIKVDPSRQVEIAQKHFDEILKPEDLFFREFANLLLSLLEKSAQRETGTIDKRIGANRHNWQALLETQLSARFGIDVEIIFDIEREEAGDTSVQTSPGEYLNVYFRDRIDQTYPLTVVLRLRQEQSTRESIALPREEAKLKTNLFDVIARTCEAHLTLHDYWYSADTVHDVVKKALNDYLKIYAHSVVNLQINRPTSEASAPPPQSEKLNQTVSWSDNRGYALEFRAEAIAVIHKDGAGLFDRKGRQRRDDWFPDVISDALKHCLAGVSVIDLNDENVDTYGEKVKANIAERAKEIGLHLELFIGKVYLPNQKWNRPTIVPIDAERYKTAHPTIPAHFSMDIELSFASRKAAEAFMNEYHQSKLYTKQESDETEGNSNALPDGFIEGAIIELALDAARFEMQRIDPTVYFTDFIDGKRWETTIPSLPAPGAEPNANVIETRIRETLEKRYPDVVLHAIHFHRIDEDLEKLRQLIAALQPIRFSCQIDDQIEMNAALDRKLEGYVFIHSGDAERIVWMLNKDFDKLTPESLTIRISEHLKKFVQTRLFNASQEELNSLMNSLTSVGSTYNGETRNALKDAIKKTIQENFALLCGDIELQVVMSDDYLLLKDERRDSLLDPLRMNQLERTSLKTQYQQLLDERAKVLGTSDDEITHRNLLTSEIDEIKRQMAERQWDAMGRSGASSSEHISSAVRLFSSQPDGDARAEPAQDEEPEAPRRSPPHIVDIDPENDETL